MRRPRGSAPPAQEKFESSLQMPVRVSKSGQGTLEVPPSFMVGLLRSSRSDVLNLAVGFNTEGDKNFVSARDEYKR